VAALFASLALGRRFAATPTASWKPADPGPEDPEPRLEHLHEVQFASRAWLAREPRRVSPIGRPPRRDVGSSGVSGLGLSQRHRLR
jgi:hypothetical protein